MKHCFLILATLLMGLIAEQSTVRCVAMPRVQTQAQGAVQDSIRRAQLVETKRVADSIKHVQDSLSMLYIGLPKPNRPNQFTDSLRTLLIVEKGDFIQWLRFAKSMEEHTEQDLEKASRKPWVLAVIGLLLLLLGIVKATFPNEVMSIIQAFYNDRMLLQINKEDTLYSSWPFVFLYILFGFATGLFIYQYNLHYLDNKGSESPESFFAISIFIMVLFVLKIVVTRFLGFIFDIQRIIREYISILYLSYFNAALVFLPIVLVLSLIPLNHMYWVIPMALFIVCCLFIFRFVKTANNVLVSYRFSKFYLFMYLCCLEIAPVLILIKVFGN